MPNLQALLARLQKNGYKATDEDIAQLATARATRGAYLKALVRDVKDYVADNRVPVDEHDTALADISKEKRAIVMRAFRELGIVDANELNKKCSFARTAEYALRAYISAGGNVTELDPHKVTKRGLTVGLATAPDDPNRRLRSTVRLAGDRLTEHLRRLTEKDPAGAEALLTSIIAKLRPDDADD